ncbi:MAG: hypothetical protein LBR26_08395 [Prevotella sp.]|jgi:hypothetical protein|nr:hypothetical protein [Prevotella sp.]
MSQGACIDFPASGNRNNSTGALNNLGVNGYAWSSSADAANGRNLNFNGTTVNPANSNNRANGFPARCVKNLTKSARVCPAGEPCTFRQDFFYTDPCIRGIFVSSYREKK